MRVLYSLGGFAAIAIAATLIPVMTVSLVARLSPVPPQYGAKPSLMKVTAAARATNAVIQKGFDELRPWRAAVTDPERP
jgi:hypothetical protein